MSKQREELTCARSLSEFYGSISVGTPSTTYSVVLDTGSADLLLATSPCTGCETTTPLYTPSDSSTSVSSSTKFSITYVRHPRPLHFFGSPTRSAFADGLGSSRVQEMRLVP